AIRWVSQRNGVARLVVPGLKMSRLGRAGAKQDSQYFRMCHPLCQRWIETVAALFDRRHMESCRVGDRLNVGVRSQISVRPRDCCKLPLIQAGDCLGERKSRIEVRVVSSAAISSPPARIER